MSLKMSFCNLSKQRNSLKNTKTQWNKETIISNSCENILLNKTTLKSEIRGSKIALNQHSFSKQAYLKIIIIINLP